MSALAANRVVAEWWAYRTHFRNVRACHLPREVWTTIERNLARSAVSAAMRRAEAVRLEAEVAQRGEAQRLFDEGQRRETFHNTYERNRGLVEEAKKRHGTACAVCRFDFGAFYGGHGEGFIEMHHRVPLSTIKGKGHKVTADALVPLCSNCHRMAHRGQDVLSVAKLRSLVAKAGRRPAARGTR